MAEKFTVFVDPRLNAAQRQAAGNEVVQYIVTRTREGRGVGNVPFVSNNGSSYSKAYQAHSDFAAAGKLPAPINLTLSGSMLTSIQVIDYAIAGRIEVGIVDEGNAEKARYMRDKGYNFLGMTDEEVQRIVGRRTFNG